MFNDNSVPSTSLSDDWRISRNRAFGTTACLIFPLLSFRSFPTEELVVAVGLLAILSNEPIFMLSLDIVVSLSLIWSCKVSTR